MPKVGKVIISTAEYNSLRDFQKEILTRNVVTIRTYYTERNKVLPTNYYTISENKTIELLEAANLKLTDRIKELEDKLAKM